MWTLLRPIFPSDAVPFVIYAIFRYLYLVYQKDEGGTPEELLMRDRPLLASIVLWGITAVVILYWGRALGI